MDNVWELETKEEKAASEYLGMIAECACAGNRKDQNYLRKLWDGESWQSIKEKLQSEGSIWYVWWMDGVRMHLKNRKGSAL